MIAALALAAALTNFYDVHVVKAVDGDTIKVELPGMPAVFSPIGVRIKGIDSAEIHNKRPCVRKQALLAKAAMVNLVQSGKVDLLFCESDKYYRLLCSVRIDEKIDAATYMKDRGLAKVYWGAKKSEKEKDWGCVNEDI
jgi:micrococcal nuclease